MACVEPCKPVIPHPSKRISELQLVRLLLPDLDSKRKARHAGVDSLAGLHQLRQAYVWVVGASMTAARVTHQCGLTLESPILEPLLHLVLGELSAACQAAAEQHSGLAEPPLDGSASLGQAEQPGSSLQAKKQTREGQAALFVTLLSLLALEGAGQGSLSFKRLIDCGAGLLEVRPTHCEG